ncbi:ACP synthase [Halorubellus sp. JP-L1]|uniref:zinc ribbon domain-containing protein n=1 Tax=Halorubellus sp. JP-L1 TaxID=2715753 RepID=UPI001407D3F7|nr:zinc ribbon domain-containing protein [Halorubellus sp. JP-L1]NHN40242.1 ACP synthase [Halorubellus sp. JP-L1]
MTDEASRNGIRAVGTYAPRHRLESSEIEDAWGSVQAAGVGEKAVPGADEDALTLGWEAATNALRADGVDADAVGFLAFATTTPPVEEEDVSVRLGSTLGVPSDARHDVYEGSTRAGTRALAAAFDADLPEGSVALVVAADCPQGEPASAEDQAAGAGAAAFVVVPDGPGVAVARGSHVRPSPGTRFRERGSEDVQGLGVTTYDRAAFRETLAGAVDDLDDGAFTEEGDVDVDAAAVQAPDGALPYRAASALGVDNDAVQCVATVHDVGDTGAASALLGLAEAMDDPEVERVLVAGYGSGAGADAFVVRTGGAVPAALAVDREDAVEVSYAEYLRLRDEVVEGPPDGGGAYVSVPSWRRTLPQRHRLVAGRCEACGALAFPPEGACVDCGALAGYEDVQLPGTGTVEAATSISQGGAPPEFAVQQQRGGDFDVVVVAFDAPEGDETVSAPAQATDAPAGAADVGDDVTAAIRRIYTQEGVTRYGFKVRPAGVR